MKLTKIFKRWLSGWWLGGSRCVSRCERLYGSRCERLCERRGEEREKKEERMNLNKVTYFWLECK
jgi:hypothetical protein